MSSKLLYSLFALLLFSLSVQAQGQTTDFAILENGEAAQLPDSISAQLQSPQQNKAQILLSWYASQGFLNAEISSQTDSTITVSKGCKFQISSFKVMASEPRDSVIQDFSGIDYSEQTVQQHIQEVIADLAEQGFLFAKATITDAEPDFEACTIQLRVEVEKGDKIRESDIYFARASSNSQEYLRKISRFQPEILVTTDYLKKLRAHLVSSQLFAEVAFPQVVFRDEMPLILMEVEERNLNQFEGLLGYVPNAAGKGQIAGNAELSLWNVFFEGSRLDIGYERLKPETSRLNAAISQNWIGNIPIGVSAGFQFYQNDTTYQSREFHLSGSYQITAGFKLTGGVEFKATTSGTNLPRVVEPDGQKRTAQLGFEYSNLDNFEVPTSGQFIAVSYGITRKSIEDDSAGTFTQNSLEVTAKQLIPILTRSVIATSVTGFLLASDKTTIEDLRRFGGAHSLRGYAEDQFRAGRLLWGDIEYRFMMNRSSYVFAFGAAGGYHRPTLFTETTNTFRNSDYLFSTGFGLSYKTQIGNLTFSYAISPDEDIANGKIHFGIRTRF